jgi:hypothetical protein
VNRLEDEQDGERCNVFKLLPMGTISYIIDHERIFRYEEKDEPDVVIITSTSYHSSIWSFNFD